MTIRQCTPTRAVPRYALQNYTDKEAMLNAEDTGSMENLFEIRRYQIDIDNEQVANLSQYILETFPSTNGDLGKSLRHFAL